MTDRPKPKAVSQAEWALWTWTAWTCLFGIYQTWTDIPQLEQVLNDQLGGMITLPVDMMMKLTVAGYAALGVLSGWIVFKIGAGKAWARSSLLWGFVCEVAMMIFPPYHGLREFLLTDAPDLILQIFALYLLYTAPGRDWFRPKPAAA